MRYTPLNIFRRKPHVKAKEKHCGPNIRYLPNIKDYQVKRFYDK